jgi:hypothetical protein
MKATLNRFASLVTDDGTEDKEETLDDDNELQLTGPVTYSLETSQWTLGGAVYHLQQFKLQNITANKRGTIFLRFDHEAQAKKVLNWITHDKKVAAKIARVSNSLGPQKCFYCTQVGHWGSECKASLLDSFPSELIALISAELRAPDLFTFMLCSRTIFNAIANRQKTVIVARPQWHSAYSIKLKLGLLKYFRSLEKLVFRQLKCLPSAIPLEAIAKNCTKLASLTINLCDLLHPSGNTADYIDEPWIRMIAGMTRLQKLDLQHQNVLPADYNKLIESLPHLTQLRVSLYSHYREETTNFVPTGLKKLSMQTNGCLVTYRGGELDRVTSLCLEPDYRSNLGNNFPDTLPSLEKLIVRRSTDFSFAAPNLTKLVLKELRHRSMEDRSVLGKFSKLRSLTLDCPTNLSGLIELEKLVVMPGFRGNLNLRPLINLKYLHLVDPTRDSVKNIPEGLEKLRITLNNSVESDLSRELSKLTKLTRFECLLSENPKHGLRSIQAISGCLEVLSNCTTLQYVKVEYAEKEILPIYAKFTQIKVLDLVQSSKNPYVPKNEPATQDDFIALSKQLPNTRIYFGFNLPTTIRRRKKGHWYSEKIEDSNLIPFDCGCEYCKAIERGYFDSEFDHNRGDSLCIDPKPFKQYWSWY